MVFVHFTTVCLSGDLSYKHSDACVHIIAFPFVFPFLKWKYDHDEPGDFLVVLCAERLWIISLSYNIQS